MTWKILAQTLAISTVVAILLGLIGPFGNWRRFALSALLYLVFCWSGSLLGIGSALVISRTPLARRGVLVRGVAIGLVMAPAMLLIVWLSYRLVLPPTAQTQGLGPMIWRVVLICIAFSLVATSLTARRLAAAPPPPVPDAAPRFADRLPLRLRGAELWAVEAEDHYLRVHTSGGQDLILLRMADALAELRGLDGAQVHRSWWVARQGVADARRLDRRATIVLKDGLEVPVSRTFTRELKGLGWI